MTKDKTLLFKSSDEKFYKYLYDSQYVYLCRFAYTILNDSFLAEEAVNDVIFYLWEHRDEVEITTSLRAYLVRSVRNRCLNILRSQHNQKEINFSAYVLPENIEILDLLYADDHYPLGDLLEQELEEKLMSYIDELPKECRTVFKKSRFEQKKYEEISADLNISVNTVKYHIKKALSILEKNMHDYLEIFLLCFLLRF